MPHIIVEHSANLNKSHNMGDLVQKLSAAAIETGVFPLAGIRVRMHPVDIFAMADGHPDNAFVAVITRIGAGRDVETQKRSNKAIYDCLCTYFAREIDAGYFAVSVDMEINNPELSFKRNGVADRLKREKSG